MFLSGYYSLPTLDWMIFHDLTKPDQLFPLKLNKGKPTNLRLFQHTFGTHTLNLYQQPMIVIPFMVG